MAISVTPFAPPHPCAADPRCPHLVSESRPCPVHRRRTGRGSTRAWRIRRMYVLRMTPFCEACLAEGAQRLAVEVDHVQPIHRGGTDAWENLQALCEAHHAAKTAREAPGRNETG